MYNFTRLIRLVPQVEQELLTLPEHLSPPPVLSRVSVTLSLVLYVCFVDRCLSFCIFSFDHCFICSSSLCGFWLPLWYLQTLLAPIQLVYCRHFLLKCLYQAWKVSGHVFVFWVFDFVSSFDFSMIFCVDNVVFLS